MLHRLLRNSVPASAAPSASAGAADSASAAQPHILIVDDIVENRDLLARRFQKRGFRITEADGGQRALDLIASQAFDVVLLDVMMPGIDGLEVLSLIRATHSAACLPVIMVTAKSYSEDVVRALENGANDYVTKPIDFAVALARVNTQIERKRAEEKVVAANEALRLANEDLESRVNERTDELLQTNQRLKSEIVHREESEAQSRYLAYHDALTGLANRLLFREELEDALICARAKKQPLAVLFIDLDGFKSVNDTLGHSIGDSLLKVITSRLRDILTPDDRIARLGGDEFAILQTVREQPATGAALATRIIDAVSHPCIVDDNEITVGASVGISICENGLSDPEDLLKNADLAMYRAKAEGRGVFRLFNPEMDAKAQARRSLEMEMRHAIAAGDFRLHYQPIVNLVTKKVVCFEALMRWTHAKRGAISPGEFIPIAEDSGLIVQLGEWALRQACAEAAHWPADIKVAVNLSSVQFLRGAVVSNVISALATSGLAPHRLELEITESVILEKSDRNMNILNQLRALGVRISMDDFGTGYSSLSYLRSFRFDKIKIDQSFVRDLATDSDSRAIVSAITGLGTCFGINTTAEGVETEDQLRFLTSDGCTEVQGRLFSMPVPSTDVIGVLRNLGQA